MADPTLTNNAGGAATTATVTATFGFTATAGRLLILSVAGDDYRTGTPTGWTLSTGCNQETYLGHSVYWKIAAGGEASVQYSIGSTTFSCWQVLEYDSISGFNTSNGQFVQASGSNPTTPSITPSAGGRRFAVGFVGGTHSGGALTGVDTWLNSYVEQREQATPSGTAMTMQAAAALALDGGSATSTGATIHGTPQARTGIILAFNVASASTDATPTPAATARAVAVPAATVTASTTPAPNALASTAAAPAVAVTAAAGTAPTVVPVTAGFPAVGVTASATVAPAAIATAATLPAPDPAAVTVASPDAVTAPAAMPPPAVQGSAVASPPAAAVAAAVPDPVVAADAAPSPAPVAATADLPAALPDTGAVTYTVFDDTEGGAQGGDSGAVTVGMRFKSAVSASVVGARYYRRDTPLDPGTPTGALFAADDAGAVDPPLASKEFGAPGTVPGWHEVLYDTPVSIDPETWYYTATYFPSGGYCATSGYFNGTSVTNGPLTAPANSGVTENGTFSYGVGLTPPDEQFGQANYWVDVLLAVDESDATPTPASIAGGSSVGDPIIFTGQHNTIPADPVASTAAIPVPVVAVDATATPSSISLDASIPEMEGVQSVDADPAAVDAAAAVPAPTVSAGSSTAPTPASIAATASVPAVTVTTGTSASPAAVTVTGQVPAPGVATAGNATTSPAVITATTAAPAPGVVTSAHATPAPSTITATASVPEAVVAASATATPSGISLTAVVPSAAVSAGGGTTASPATVTATSAVPAPSVSTTASATPAPAAVTITAMVPTAAPRTRPRDITARVIGTARQVTVRRVRR